MSGWLKLHRKIIEKAIWQDPQMLKLWLYCLIRANHTETEVLIEKQEIKLYPGQFVTGRFALADEYNRGAKKRHRVSPDTLWRWLKKFQEWEMLHIKSTNKYSVITIKNWDAYQQTAQEMHNNCTTDAQQMHTDKNDKNDKNEKNINNKRHKYEICDMRLAELLYQEILKNNPNHKKPNLEKWANDIRLIRERDERTEEQIEYLILWTQQHEFWHTNILSPSKLRKQWDRLVLQVKQEKNKKSNVTPITKARKKDKYNYNLGF